MYCYEIGCLMHGSVKTHGEMRHFGKKGIIFAINVWVFLCPIRTNMLELSSISDLSNVLSSSKSIVCEMLLFCVI